MLNGFRLALLGGLLVFVVGGSAGAFERVGENSEPAQDRLNLSAEKPKVETPAAPSITIPGLSSLGVLPKLDFGLELLYGNPEVGVAPDLEPKQEKDGLEIKGTLKHRF